MTASQFDDIFKKRLGSHESSVPGDMWDRISSEKRKRRPLFWWFTSTIVFIALSIYYLLTINTTKVRGPADSKNQVQKIQNVENEKNPGNGTNLPGNFKKPGKKLLAGIKNRSENNTSLRKTSDPFITDPRPALTIGRDLFNLNPIEKGAAPNEEIPRDPGKDSVQTKTIISIDTARENKTAQEESSVSSEEDNGEIDKWFIEVFVSPAVPVNRIKSGNAAYERSLKKSFSTRTSFAVGANIGYKVNKGLSVKTGLYFAQVNGRYSFPDSVLSGTRVVKNHYSFVGVPLLLTINKEFKPGLRTAFTAGVIINIASRYKGLIPSPFGGILDIKKDDIYTTNTRMDLYMGLSLSRHLNKNIDLYAEPFLRYQLKNMTTDFQAFDHKINIVGLSFGLRHYLFKDKDR